MNYVVDRLIVYYTVHIGVVGVGYAVRGSTAVKPGKTCEVKYLTGLTSE